LTLNNNCKVPACATGVATLVTAAPRLTDVGISRLPLTAVTSLAKSTTMTSLSFMWGFSFPPGTPGASMRRDEQKAIQELGAMIWLRDLRITACNAVALVPVLPRWSALSYLRIWQVDKRDDVDMVEATVPLTRAGVDALLCAMPVGAQLDLTEHTVDGKPGVLHQRPSTVRVD
jgi:hypothetical protein